MPTAEAPPSPEAIAPANGEREAIERAHSALNAMAVERRGSVFIEDLGSERINLPPSIVRAVRLVAEIFVSGAAVAIASVQKRISTNTAADLLDVSRPHLIKLLDAGKIPYTMVGSHRRILFSDLVDYKRTQDMETLARFQDLVRESHAAGLYDVDVPLANGLNRKLLSE